MTTFRRPLKPLPVVRLCPVCLGWRFTAEELRQHNEMASAYGERSYGTKR